MKQIAPHQRILNVAIFGTGDWAQRAHIPAFRSCRNTRVLAICGQDPERSSIVAKKYSIPRSSIEYDEFLEDPDIDIISIATSSDRHFPLALKAIKAGKSVLCEKPLADSFAQAKLLANLAHSQGVKTKVAFGYRYSPSIRRMKELIDSGYLGQPYHFNGFEQNSQYIDKLTEFPWSREEASKRMVPGSLREYAPHVIDLAMWLFGNFKSVVAEMKNFIPLRKVRGSSGLVETNMEDGCVWLAEFASSATCTMQSSFVAIGQNPGLEVRAYGSKGALLARLPDESGSLETLKGALQSHPNFIPLRIPNRLKYLGKKDLSPGQIRFSLLVRAFANEILVNSEPECSFKEGAKVQEIIAAVSMSHFKRKWIDLPLKRDE